mmetsp:Transcript_14012/g.52552  ORF Transcript_14012/g.52552 Transcript_14012/m.52552 type:complete len:217 (+) Transcript_14012:2309-2959(+)
MTSFTAFRPGAGFSKGTRILNRSPFLVTLTFMPSWSKPHISAPCTVSPHTFFVIATIVSAWSAFMCVAIGTANAATGSTSPLKYSSPPTAPARANPPTKRAPTTASILCHEKSPKSTQKASGCFFRYSSLAVFCSSVSFNLVTVPVKVTRPSPAPVKPGAVTVSEQLPFAARSPVCDDIDDIAKIGLPVVSEANPTMLPLGYAPYASPLPNVLITA